MREAFKACGKKESEEEATVCERASDEKFITNCTHTNTYTYI